MTAALLALAFRETALVLALPVLVLAAFPLVQIVRVAPELVPDFFPHDGLFPMVFDGVMIAWVTAMTVRAVDVALASFGRAPLVASAAGRVGADCADLVRVVDRAERCVVDRSRSPATASTRAIRIPHRSP